MTDKTKFFSSVQPKVYPPPARQLVDGDRWINGDVEKMWNGTAWVIPEEAAPPVDKTEKIPMQRRVENEFSDDKKDDDKDDVDENQATVEKAQRDAAEARRQELDKETIEKAHRDSSPPPPVKADDNKKGGAHTPSHKKGGK